MLGGMTDALRDSGAKRIAGWDSDYRTLRNPLLGPRPGPPSRGLPRGAPRDRRDSGKIPGGKFPGPGRARPGAPRGAPGAPAGTPRNPPKTGVFRGFLGYFSTRNPPKPPIWGCQLGCTLGAPGPPRAGGQKSAHFFGYLITLPVGTVWATFFHPPFWDSSGDNPGAPAEGSVYRTPWHTP